MVIEAIKKPVHRERATNQTSNTSIQHYALIYPQKFKKKPGEEVGKIHNHFKRNPYPRPYTLRRIVDAFCSGQTLMLAMAELELKNAADKEKAKAADKNSREWADLHIMGFRSTQLLGIDIDDEYSETDIQAVLEHFKGRVSAAYYSFSHQKPNNQGGIQNRYRLLFQFDKPITDYEVGKEIVKLIRDELLKVYPQFPSNKIDTMQPKTLWHGSSRPPVFIDDTAFMDTDIYVAKVEKALEDKREALRITRKNQAAQFRSQTENAVTFEELSEMAQAIGHIPTGTDQFEKWRNLSLSIRSHEVAGHISSDEGLQLFDIVSGGESSENDYFNFKPNGRMSIGTFINHATDAGYKRNIKYSYVLQNVSEAIPRESIKVNDGIPTALAIELIQRRERLLIDSPTGSYKTTAFMNAFKELANKDYHYYIFTAPTIPLTQQIAKDHNVMCVTGGMSNLRSDIMSKAVSGHRVFVATYDKTAELISYLENGISYGNKPPEFTIVVDEVHKFTEAYNYRFAAIDRLEMLTNSAVSFIGLSGTPEDILKDGFDKLIKIDTGNSKSPCLDYRVFTYNKMDEADVMLIPVIRGLLHQTRVLLFINSKDRIKRIARMLGREGISTKTVTSDTKQSATYLNIVEKGEIEDSVQVVIATTVLADGISLKNGINWSCVVAADRGSPIFNPSTIKQISNRFRKDYRYFCLYLHKPNPEYGETKRFFIESEYRYRRRVVTRYVEYLNEEFKEGRLQDFIPSSVEKHNGIYYRSKEELAGIQFNPLFVRHQSMRKKESHYKLFRFAFIEEVGRQLGRKLSGVFSVNEEVEKNGSDLSGLLAVMEAEKEQEKLEAAELREAFKVYFDESIYGCFVRGDEEALKHFKEDVHADQYAATLKNCKIADYETCKTLGIAVKNRNDTNKYVNDIKALAELASFDYVKKITVTKRIFLELLKMEGKDYFSSDFKEITEQRLPKKLKVKPSDVKETLKLFHKFHSRPGGESNTTIRPLSVELVAKIRHVIVEDSVKSSVFRYVRQRSGQQQKVLLPAITAKWGIEVCEEEDFFA